ncbi:MAG: serine/threonine protein kinase [Phycisphaerales bacterium]
MTYGILSILVFCFVIVVVILAVLFLIVPLLRGIGWLIGGFFKSLGWLIGHVFEFISGMLRDTVRFVGALIAGVVLLPVMLLNVVIGRWSAAGHFGRSMKRECSVAGVCLYRVVLQRPLRFLLLGGLLEGLEQRVDEAVLAVPPADQPTRRAWRSGQFDGYTIVGSLPSGGSGAKLYIAEPQPHKRAGHRDFPKRVVIKYFTLSDGSTLPQIVRESRALEAAKQLGLVLEHDMDEHRFFYVMPYHQGDHLGIITRQIHGESDGEGLGRGQLAEVLGYIEDLLATLSRYHRGGLWHKDVKPENLIVHDGRVHLVDLGLVTPLRSAMTLTTHGTEYFRDPEMVRMAIRGVKVHQVDGAKFDIYAVGAVLYFIIEGTFPAHGGLSTFDKKSPEALRWIIRRAMADYNKRYETTEQVLADLEIVRAAADPFAVKPAELPSMRGPGEVAAQDFESERADDPQAQVVASAGSPKPPSDEQRVKIWGAYVGPEGVKAGRVTVDDQGVGVGAQPPPPPAAAGRRPKLRVTNWWTGAYQAQDRRIAADAAAAAAAAAAAGPALGRAAREFRGQAEVLRRRVRNQAVGARRAAREQIKTARARAREMHRAARNHRRRALDQRQPSPMLAFLAVAVLLAGAFLLLPLTTERSGRAEAQELARLAEAVAAARAHTSGRGLSLLLVNDHPAATDPLVQAKVNKIVQEHHDQGWVVLVDNRDAEVAVRKSLPAGMVDPGEPMPPLLIKTLLRYNLAGILRISSSPGGGESPEPYVTRIVIGPSADPMSPQPDVPTDDNVDEQVPDSEDR